MRIGIRWPMGHLRRYRLRWPCGRTTAPVPGVALMLTASIATVSEESTNTGFTLELASQDSFQPPLGGSARVCASRLARAVCVQAYPKPNDRGRLPQSGRAGTGQTEESSARKPLGSSPDCRSRRAKTAEGAETADSPRPGQSRCSRTTAATIEMGRTAHAHYAFLIAARGRA